MMPRESGPQLFEVTNIISEKSNILIVSKTILESYFQAHFEAYEITSSSYEGDVFSVYKNLIDCIKTVYNEIRSIKSKISLGDL